MTFNDAKIWLEVFNIKIKESIKEGELHFKIGILNSVKLSQAIDIILNEIKED